MSKAVTEQQQLTRAPEFAILGNASGQVLVQPRRGINNDNSAYGLVYVRRTNSTVLIVIGDGKVSDKDWGVPVEIEPVGGLKGIYRIARYAIPEARDNNVDVISITNTEAPRQDMWVQDFARDMQTRAARGSDKTYSALKVVRNRYSQWAYDGTLHQSELGFGNEIDLSGAQPSASNETFVLTYHDPVVNADSYVSFLSRTSSGAKLTTAQRQSALQALPHQLAIPGDIWRVSGNKTAITPDDYKGSLRQLWNTHLPSGFPTTISRNWIIPDGWQQLMTGELTLNGASLEVAGELVFL